MFEMRRHPKTELKINIKKELWNFIIYEFLFSLDTENNVRLWKTMLKNITDICWQSEGEKRVNQENINSLMSNNLHLDWNICKVPGIFGGKKVSSDMLVYF